MDDDPGTVSIHPGDDYPDPGRGAVNTDRHDLDDNAVRYRTKTLHLTPLLCPRKRRAPRRKRIRSKHQSVLHSANSCQVELHWHIDHASGSEWVSREISTAESIDRADPVRGEASENVSRNRGGAAAPRLGKEAREIGGALEDE
jgi:hypothetical protein